jgi:HD superfamily phosphohydrolase
VLEPELAQDIGSLIHAGVMPSPWMRKIDERVPSLQALLRQLISGEADADRMDYLLRDSYFCGVAYGAYDIDWLISSMSAVEHEGKFVLTLAENGVRAFEAFLLARYHMFDQVYFHKTKAGFIHYLEQAIATHEIPLVIPTDPYAYAGLHDGAVIEQLFDAARDHKNYWSHHIMARIPARRILRLQEAVSEDRETFVKIRRLCDENRIHWFTHRAGKELTSLGQDASHHLFVQKKTLDGVRLVPMMEYSDLLMKYNEKLRFLDVFVHREDVDVWEKVVGSSV